jgi:hypothetical protein
MIREITGEVPEKLIEIWKQCFGDEEAYIRTFLCKNQDYMRIFIFEEDKTPVSVAYLLDAEYTAEDKTTIPLYYLYAAATAPEYQKKGYFGGLLEWIFSHAGRPVILVPANPQLIEFYEHKGMHVWQQEEYVKIFLSYAQVQGKIAQADAVWYTDFRHKCWYKRGYVRWDCHMMNYILQENEFCSGFCRKITIYGTDYAVLARKNGDCLEVLEVLSENGEYQNCVQLLLAQTHCTYARVCVRPEVMCTADFPIEMGAGYFNLTMG